MGLVVKMETKDEQLREAAKALLDEIYKRHDEHDPLKWIVPWKEANALRAALEDRRKGERRMTPISDSVAGNQGDIDLVGYWRKGRGDLRIATEDRRKGKEQR